MTSHLLLIDCADEPGLVHRITGALFRGGFNITSNQEFVDPVTGRFFMRTAFAGDGPAAQILDELGRALPAGSTVRLAPTGRRPIVVLVTREPHCLGDLLVRHAYGELPARIEAVVGNHETLAPLAAKFDLPFHLVSHEGLTREAHERALLDTLATYAPHFVVLAKYMRVLSPQFVAHYPGRILNIHHSFLPAFAGASAYRQAFERGVKIIGATAHLVTDDLDAGPIIAQAVVPVDHTHGVADMAQAGRDIEKTVLARALGLVLEERVFLHGHRTVVFE